MKQILVIAGLGLALTGCMTTAQWSEAPLEDGRYSVAPPVAWWGQDVASVAMFEQALAPYGTWARHNRFGRVFLPMGVGPDWQPFSGGRWMRDPRFGPVFASADPWGWATYHYGRWGRDSRFGWYWIPDVRFAPAVANWPNGWAGQGWPAGPANPDRWYGGPGWMVGQGPGWHPGWNDGWNGGSWSGWNGRWRDRDHRDDRDRDRDWDRDRDRDRDWVDRTRPGESPMAGFVRNRVPPPAPQGQPAVTAPSEAWVAPRRGQRSEAPRGEAMREPPREAMREPPRGDAMGGGAMGGFVRNRTQPGGAGFARAPAEARPQAERVAAPPPRVEQPSYRAERPQPSYQRAEPSYQRDPEAPRGREPKGRDVPQRVADD